MFDKAKDPVCKMKIKRSATATTSEYEGKLYYFCSEKCREQFDKNASKYV
ncbi:YHS domain-containing protein [Candidatus Aerophobetes bacterium]|nr:YHS domain-containing protein [Candidatus Aerophobetes bacterium]